jgi:3-deoxy-D-manno-octulosonic-acid transferase
MRWIVYNLLFAIGYTLVLPTYLPRMFRRGGYRRNLLHRFGRYDAATRARLVAPGPAFVWIHAVSVGEVYVAGQVMRALRDQVAGIRFVLSTTSSTGWCEAEKQTAPADVLIYAPLDFPGCVRRALAVIRPRAFILTESEIWPNLIRACDRRGVPLFLVNGRISDRSAPGYRRLRLWFGPALRCFRSLMVQSDLDRRRLLAAGADPARIEVTGSVKFDVATRHAAKEQTAADVLARLDMGAPRVVLLGGSTWPGEEAALLEIYRQFRGSFPDLRLVLVPRHFERGDAVAAEVEKAGFTCVRKSELDKGAAPAATGVEAVLLVDTTGEIMGFYAHAALVFVGKSLCSHGAQNMIEPCLCGAATVVGPYTENFRPVMADLLAASAIIQVTDAARLAHEVERLMTKPAEREALGRRAVAAVERRRGVVGRCAARIVEQAALRT